MLQAVYLYTVDLASATGALERRVCLFEHTLERVGDVDAGSHRAVEGACEVTTLVSDTAALLGILLVDAVARLVGRVRTVGEQQVGAVVAEVDVDLDAGARRLAETPLATRAPVTVVLGHRSCGGTHGRHLGDAGLEGSHARCVDGHGQVDECYAAQH